MTTTTAPTPVGAVPAMARALWLDAAVSGAAGVLLTAGAGVLDEPLGIPTPWLLGLGAFLLLFAADVGLLARMLPRSRRLVRPLGIGNVGWVLASVAAVVVGAWELTGLGVAFVLAQAAAVTVFAVLQLRASAG